MAASRPRVFYRISEIAALVGVTPAVLRHWERTLGVPQPMKTSGSHRHYRRHDVDLAIQVRAMLEGEGLTLAGVRRRLAGKAALPPSPRAVLVGLREELESLRRKVRAGEATRKRRPIVTPE